MKAFVAYFSASGQTAKLAKTIAGVTGGSPINASSVPSAKPGVS